MSIRFPFRRSDVQLQVQTPGRELPQAIRRYVVITERAASSHFGKHCWNSFVNSTGSVVKLSGVLSIYKMELFEEISLTYFCIHLSTSIFTLKQ